MKATDGVYFQERVNYYNQFKGTLLKSFNKNISDVNKIYLKGLMLLIINCIFLACQIEKTPDLQLDLHGGQFNLYISNDTLGELRDENNNLLKKGKCSIVNTRYKIFIEVFSQEIICYDKVKNVILSQVSLRENFNIIAELKPLSDDFIILISPEKMYIYDDKLKIRMSPLDSVFLRNRRLRLTSIQKWSYSILEDKKIKIIIPQIDGSNVVKIISLKSLR